MRFRNFMIFAKSSNTIFSRGLFVIFYYRHQLSCFSTIFIRSAKSNANVMRNVYRNKKFLTALFSLSLRRRMESLERSLLLLVLHGRAKELAGCQRWLPVNGFRPCFDHINGRERFYWRIHGSRKWAFFVLRMTEVCCIGFATGGINENCRYIYGYSVSMEKWNNATHFPLCIKNWIFIWKKKDSTRVQRTHTFSEYCSITKWVLSFEFSSGL